MKKYVLASKSPRRQELIKTLNIPFEIIPSKYDENLEGKEFSHELIKDVATNKALDVAKKLTKDETIIIGADTVVVLGKDILLKPKNKQDAFNMLKKLSGRTHSVVTAICVVNSSTKEILCDTTTSYVTFQNLTDEQIWNYIETKQPLDKAGAYGIQELDETFIKTFEGSKDNIIGLCPKALKKLLDKLDKMNSID